MRCVAVTHNGSPCNHSDEEEISSLLSALSTQLTITDSAGVCCPFLYRDVCGEYQHKLNDQELQEIVKPFYVY